MFLFLIAIFNQKKFFVDIRATKWGKYKLFHTLINCDNQRKVHLIKMVNYNHFTYSSIKAVNNDLFCPSSYKWCIPTSVYNIFISMLSLSQADGIIVGLVIRVLADIWVVVASKSVSSTSTYLNTRIYIFIKNSQWFFHLLLLFFVRKRHTLWICRPISWKL